MSKKSVTTILSTLGAIFFLSLTSSHSALASSTMPEKMKCEEFINLNPKAMLPVAWWMLHEKTIYKGGDSVSLQESDVTRVPEIIEYCKKNPAKDLYTFQSKLSNVLPN